MPARVIVTGILLVTITALLVFIVEFFLPLSMKSDMNMICRNTLLKMEAAGGLSDQDKSELQLQLQNKGFIEIFITGTQKVKQGDSLNIHVEAQYTGSRLTALLKRETVRQLMVYDKTSLSRRVVN